MLFHLLQTTPPIEAEKFSADTLVAKGSQLVETIRTTPADQLLQGTLSSVAKFGLKVLLALLIYIVGAWLIRKTKSLIAKAFEKKKSDSTLSSFMQSLVSAILWIVLILSMVGTLGINTTSIAALLAAGGMAIGMAMSGTVQNFAGGLMLLAFKPFKAGDYIEAQGFAGVVKSINIVSTKIVTLDNREVILPNGALSNGTINNYSANPLRRIDLTVNVSYGSDAEAVKAELMRIIGENEKILDAETTGAQDPTVVLSDLKDSSVEFLVRVWVHSSDIREVRYALTEAIYTGLPAHGISFPFPQLDIHLKHS